MKAARNPWMKFYPSDWRADAMLRLCSIAARGLWAEMMCLMHEAERYGSLLVNGRRIDKKQLAGLAGISERECTALILELEGNGVFSRDGDGTIFSRRMRRDFEKAAKDRENGKGGGNPILKGWVNPPDNGEDKAQRLDARSKSLELDKERKKDSECAALRAPPDVSRETVSPKSKRGKARSPLPDDWKPNERDTAHAVERGFVPTQIVTMAAGFSNHHRARGNLMADWQAAWRTWVDNEIKFQRSNGYGSGRPKPLQDDSLSVSRAIDRRLATPGTLVFPPRPSLLPIEREDDRRLLPAGRSAES